jgi:gamma-glutamyltranspeptidase / glutathione hydrolase
MPRTLIAAASVAAAEAGAAVADAGGNAVDAAIAASIASMTTELGIVSPGGGAFVTVWPPSGRPIVIDAYAEMPGRGSDAARAIVTEQVSMQYGGGMETIVGWGSVATPGAFAGFELAHEAYGDAPWQELFVPSIRLATDGFSVSTASAHYLGYSHDVVYGWDDETAVTYHGEDGTAVEAGDTVVNPLLAETLRAIGDQGAALLYRGDLGAELVRASAERGGLITRADLEAYEAIVRPPSRIMLHGWDVATNAPPAVGGITVAALITLIERMKLSGWSSTDVAAMAAAQSAVFSFRRTDLDGDRDRIAASEDLAELADRGDLASMHRSPSTVHVSAVDESGLACSITSSAGYGSGATIPGTGFGLNNSLGEVELISEGLHALAPGTRLLSNMAPTIARKSDGQTLAIGSPGADRITSAIASVLFNYIVCGMDVDHAVAAPRIHAEIFDGVPTLAVEEGVDVSGVSDLEVRSLPRNSMYFGGVQVALMDDARNLVGAADPRRSGAVRTGG